MKYTTKDKIARRLRNRLNLGEYPEVESSLGTMFGYGTSVADNQVDENLIDQIAEEQESYIDLILSQLYKWPLQLTSEITRNILSDISSCFIISSLIQIHFEGTNPVLQASDISQASMDLRRQGEFRLAQLTAGTNIFIPNTLQAPNQAVNIPQAQPLRLPGEILLGQGSQPDILNRNYTFKMGRNIRTSNIYFQDGINGVRRDGSARGSEPYYYDVETNSYRNYEEL